MPPAEAERAAQLASRVAFGIVTALPEERAAVLAMLDEPVPYAASGKGAGFAYDLGAIPAFGGGSHAVAVALAGMGNNIAAARGTLLLQHFKHIEAILMVGIAGGVPCPEKPAEHVRLGDVVVSDSRGVVQFDFVKKTRRHVAPRHPPRPPCARLLESVNHLVSDALTGRRPWEEHLQRAAHIEGAARPSAATDLLVKAAQPDESVAHPADPQRREGMPRIFQGVIGSSGTLLKDARERDRLRDQLGLRAVEMEASGVADATWNHGVGFLAIRGICDYCDGNKNDLWHVHAAVVAAAYARALLERTVSQAPKPKGRKPRAPETKKPAPSAPNNLPPRSEFGGHAEKLAPLDAGPQRHGRTFRASDLAPRMFLVEDPDNCPRGYLRIAFADDGERQLDLEHMALALLNRHFGRFEGFEGLRVICVNPLHYDNLEGMLDDIYTQFLRDRYPPYTYGRDWVLAKASTYVSLLALPWQWLQHRREKLLIDVIPDYRKRSTPLADFGMNADSVWAIVNTGFDRAFGLFTSREGVAEMALEEITKGLHFELERGAGEPASAVTSLADAAAAHRHRFVMVNNCGWWNMPPPSGFVIL